MHIPVLSELCMCYLIWKALNTCILKLKLAGTSYKTWDFIIFKCFIPQLINYATYMWSWRKKKSEHSKECTWIWSIVVEVKRKVPFGGNEGLIGSTLMILGYIRLLYNSVTTSISLQNYRIDTGFNNPSKYPNFNRRIKQKIPSSAPSSADFRNVTLSMWQADTFWGELSHFYIVVMQLQWVCSCIGTGIDTYPRSARSQDLKQQAFRQDRRRSFLAMCTAQQRSRFPRQLMQSLSFGVFEIKTRQSSEQPGLTSKVTLLWAGG